MGRDLRTHRFGSVAQLEDAEEVTSRRCAKYWKSRSAGRQTDKTGLCYMSEPRLPGFAITRLRVHFVVARRLGKSAKVLFNSRSRNGDSRSDAMYQCDNSDLGMWHRLTPASAAGVGMRERA